MKISRRQVLASGSLLAQSRLLRAATVPTPKTVAVAKCASYDRTAVLNNLNTMFDQIGGLPRLVRGKTVTVKLNMTGSPEQKFRGLPLGETHYVHPEVVLATAHLIGQAGARRIRFVESAFQTGEPLEQYMVASGWDVQQLGKTAPIVEFENTNNLGKGKQYVRFDVPGQAYLFPGYDLNHSYRDTDVFVSMAKLKNHAVCGVTLSLKNCFGNTPASIYGADAGIEEPNENPRSVRAATMHSGAREPSKCSPQELDPSSPRDPGYRMPRIVAELTLARPVDLAVIDGVLSVAGGEGPWIRGLRAVRPGVLIAGTNAVNSDTVAAAIMGYDPRGLRGSAGFPRCDNTLLLSERIGVGSADLKNIEVAGVPISQALYSYSRA
jgi:uncharacterized protein (DUF362 family)